MSRDGVTKLVKLDLHWHARGETDRAICVSENGNFEKEKQWIPKSMIVSYEVSEDGKSVDVMVEEWFAKKRGFV